MPRRPPNMIALIGTPSGSLISGASTGLFVIGEVKRLFSNGAQDVMEVQATGGAKTHLLPWVPTVVKDVNLSERKILVEWQLDW